MNAFAIPLISKLAAFAALSEAECSAIVDLHRRRRSFAKGQILVSEGQIEQRAFVLASGWVSSYKILPSGTRQIVDFQIPGDFLGLRSVLFRTADHNIETVTKVEASEILASDLIESFKKYPRLATAVLWAASRDEAMVVEHLVDLGRRDALERTAHFLLELHSRLQLVGLSTNAGYSCPLSQYLLADALGLSAIHVNRILRQLREKGLVRYQQGKVTFDDYDGLVELAGFESTYLDHPEPILI